MFRINKIKMIPAGIRKIICFYLACVPIAAFGDVFIFYQPLTLASFGRFLFYSAIEIFLFFIGILTGYFYAKTQWFAKPKKTIRPKP